MGLNRCLVTEFSAAQTSSGIVLNLLHFVNQSRLWVCSDFKMTHILLDSSQ